MHAEGKKATQTSKAADNEREGVPYLNPLSKAIACTQFEIRHLFKIEASSFLDFSQSQTCSSRSHRSLVVIAKGRLQGEPLAHRGPQQIGKHATDLVHVLNQAKVVLSLEMKLVFYTVL